jgi:hypothetical protein
MFKYEKLPISGDFFHLRFKNNQLAVFLGAENLTLKIEGKQTNGLFMSRLCNYHSFYPYKVV